MIINHNMASLNTYRQLSANNANSGKSLEKLSSGLRINRAGDDAAGLAISEKMRGQIRGLDQASRNAQDATSLLNTAEGNLSETQNILQRMKELATQAANDTNVGVDRAEIQKEINQLTSEINRIGNTTEFNTQKLLNGGGVDPASAATGGAKLIVPVKLNGGLAGSTPASSQFTMTTVDTDTMDGKSMELQLGDRKLTITYDSTAEYSNVSGNTITLKVSDTETGTLVANDLANQLTSLITADEKLRGNYTVANNGVGQLTIASANASYDNATGQLTGNINNGVVKLTDNATSFLTVAGVTNTAAAGARAFNTIDFSNITKEDLVGSGIIVNGKEIDFYDSSKGAYTGTADYSIDLNGARTPEKIVDAIVSNMKGASAVADTGVWFSKSNSNSLQITAAASGIAGNDIALANNSTVKVNTVYNNDRLSGEGVVSARGLADGEQKVTISRVSSSVTTIADTVATSNVDDTQFDISLKSDTTLQDGTYRLTNVSLAAGANHVQLQRYIGTDGDLTAGANWETVSGYEDLTIADDSTLSFGDLTIKTATALGEFTAAAAGTNVLQLEIKADYYTAQITEADGTAGTAVKITNGQQNVALEAQDGVGSAIVNVGAWDETKFNVGDSISWSFDTKKGSASTDVVGGQFKATFQIGANMGQSMSIDINDMRSRALLVAGTEAGGEASVEGAVFTAVKNVTNGTDDNNVEYALDVSSHTKATAAIQVLQNAIEKVSAERSKLGAYTNRLEHTITNLGTSSENMTAAESRIRDVDMAKEMMNFQKNNILSQAAQAMLAQANQQPQGVLQLLR